jgi:cellobiose-specific phosphotransferase system component IIC
VRQLSRMRKASLIAILMGVLALTTAMLAVLMIAFCGRHWMKEYSGLGKAGSTFSVSLGIVGTPQPCYGFSGK